MRLAAILFLLLTCVPAFAQYAPPGLPAQRLVDGVLRPSILTYPRPTWWLGSQGWWTDKTTPPEGRHVHFEMAMPQGQTVKGVVEFEFRVLLHAMPQTSKGTLVRVLRQSDTDHPLFIQKLNLIPDAHGDAEKWFRFSYDTTKLHEGINELRCTLKVRNADGSEHYQSTGWCMRVDNNSSSGSNDRSPLDYNEARGWYTGFGYSNARIKTPLLKAPIPAGQFWSPRVEFRPGAGTGSTTRWEVVLDPDFHAGNQGRLLRSGTGDFNGNIPIPSGYKKLVLLSHKTRSNGRSTGVLVIPLGQ
jgi:hypothetical protein